MKPLYLLVLASATLIPFSFASAKGLSMRSGPGPTIARSETAPPPGRAPVHAVQGPVYGSGEISRVRGIVVPPRRWAREHVLRHEDWIRGRAQGRHAASQNWRVIHVGSQGGWRAGPAIYGVARTLTLSDVTDRPPVVRSSGPRIILGGAGKTWRDAIPVVYGF